MKKLFKKLSSLSLSELYTELRWIWQYIKKYKNSVALYVVIGFFSSALALVPSVLSKRLINAVTAHDGAAVVPAAVWLAVFGVLNIILTAVMSRISVRSNTMCI